MKLSTFLCKLLSGLSLLSLPHSQEKIHPDGAFGGSGGIGFRASGNLRDSLSHAPRLVHAEKRVSWNGTYMTPTVGIPFMMKPIDTQYIGQRWM